MEISWANVCLRPISHLELVCSLLNRFFFMKRFILLCWTLYLLPVNRAFPVDQDALYRNTEGLKTMMDLTEVQATFSADLGFQVTDCGSICVVGDSSKKKLKAIQKMNENCIPPSKESHPLIIECFDDTTGIPKSVKGGTFSETEIRIDKC